VITFLAATAPAQFLVVGSAASGPGRHYDAGRAERLREEPVRKRGAPETMPAHSQALARLAGPGCRRNYVVRPQLAATVAAHSCVVICSLSKIKW
jgi:hypothetical protein